MDFALSARVADMSKQVVAFMDEYVIRPSRSTSSNCSAGELPLSPPVMKELKLKAQKAGLWNLFMTHDDLGAGLTNLEYAPLAGDHGQVDHRKRSLQLAPHRTPATWSFSPSSAPRAEADLARATATSRHPIMLRDD